MQQTFINIDRNSNKKGNVPYNFNHLYIVHIAGVPFFNDSNI